MSTTAARTIARFLTPYMLTVFLRPTGDDGIHLVGYDKAGVWHEFATLEAATQFTNSERWREMQATK